MVENLLYLEKTVQAFRDLTAVPLGSGRSTKLIETKLYKYYILNKQILNKQKS